MPEKLLFLTIGIVGFTTVAAATTFPPERRRNAFAFLLGWLVPGWGHLLLGKWRKAIFFFVTLSVLYLSGLWLVGFRTVGFDDNPFYYVGQYGCGLTTFLGFLLGKVKAYPRQDLSYSLYDPGLLYVCVAGLLNIVVMLNCFDGRPKSKEKPS